MRKERKIELSRWGLDRKSRIIRERYAEIAGVFKFKNKLIPVIFRIGDDGGPSV